VSIDGNPNSFAYVQNTSTISGLNPTIMRVDSEGLFKIASADSFAPAADTVGNEIYFSSAVERVKVNLFDGTYLIQNNATRCVSDATRFRLPGIHAAPLQSGNVALVTVSVTSTSLAGVNIRHWNSSLGVSNQVVLQPDPFVSHGAGPPTSVALLKKLSDTQFLLQSSPLHLAGLQTASVYAVMLTGGYTSNGYVTNGTTCDDKLFRIEHISLIPRGVSAIFTTRNETEPTILDLWWLSYSASNASSTIVKRLYVSNGSLFLRENDLTDSRAIPVAFDSATSGKFFIIARVGPSNSSTASAYTFYDGDYVDPPGGEFVAVDDAIFATAVIRDTVLAIGSGSKNISFYSPTLVQSAFPCSTCAVVAVLELAVVYDTAPSGLPTIFSLNPTTGLQIASNNTVPGRRYTTHSVAGPDLSLFVVITTEGSYWYAELWNASGSNLVKVGEKQLSDNLAEQPVFCGAFTGGTLIVVPQTGRVTYTYWSFYNLSTEYEIASFPLQTETWCSALVEEKRAVINTATRVLLVDLSSSDPVPKREFLVPEGTTLSQQMDIYRPVDSFQPRLIATAVEINRDQTLFEKVVTMPWDFCLSISDCGATYDCVNSECVVDPIASSPALSPPSFVTPTNPGPSTPPSSPPLSGPTGCVGPPPFAGALCVGSTWVIQGSVNITANGTVVILSNTVINGTFVVSGSNISVVIAPGATLEVTGCAQFDGNLVVNVPTTLVTSPLTVITFNGYCGGLPTRFTATSLRLDSNETCAKLITQEPPAEYTDRSVAILFSFDRSECSSASTGLSTGAIVGIVIGIVALFAIIAIILILRFKGVIRPFADHEKSKPTTVEDPDL
jgi:hypothetical protein